MSEIGKQKQVVCRDDRQQPGESEGKDQTVDGVVAG